MLGHVRHCVGGHYHLRVTRPPDVVGYGAVEASAYPASFTTPAGVITAGAWHHYAVTYDAAALKLYVDGVEVGIDPRPTPTLQNPSVGTDVPFTVGGWIDVASQCSTGVQVAPVRGDIDDLVVFSRRLAAAEIVTLMNQGPCALP